MSAPCVHGFRYSGPAVQPRDGSSCERPAQLTCGRCDLVVTVDCHSSRTATCEPCGLDYRDRVRRVARVPAGGLLLVTLTAPGAPGHKHNVGGKTVRRIGKDGKRHTQHVGGAWVTCPCAPDSWEADDLAEWNATAGARWNRFLNNGVRRSPRMGWMWGAYFKAAEGQRRGALHFHVLVRVAEGREVTSRMLDDLSRMAVDYGFGHVVDVEAVESHRAAGYVAKYVSKGANDRPSVPWSREHATFGRLRSAATFRTWTSSRDWPHTMRRLVEDRRHYAALMLQLPAWPDDAHEPPAAWLDGLPTRLDWQPPAWWDRTTGELLPV